MPEYKETDKGIMKECNFHTAGVAKCEFMKVIPTENGNELHLCGHTPEGQLAYAYCEHRGKSLIVYDQEADIFTKEGKPRDSLNMRQAVQLLQEAQQEIEDTIHYGQYRAGMEDEDEKHLIRWMAYSLHAQNCIDNEMTKDM